MVACCLGWTSAANGHGSRDVRTGHRDVDAKTAFSFGKRKNKKDKEEGKRKKRRKKEKREERREKKRK